MKKLLLFTFIIVLTVSLFSQDIFVKQSVVINVEVPVRVFQGSSFVDNLTIDDFEVLENGIPQRIEAVYLVKKKSIHRSEEKKRFSPLTSRNFYLLFEISDYIPKLGEAVSYFIHNVLTPGDNLVITTPMRTYRLKERALDFQSRGMIENKILGILRKDIIYGNSEYRNTIHDLEGIAKSLSIKIQSGSLDPTEQTQTSLRELDEAGGDEFVELDLDEQLVYYESLLYKLETLREIDQIKLLDFSKYLLNKVGQKNVFLFYQREFIPQIDPRILTQYMNQYEKRPDILAKLTSVFGFYKRDSSLDVDLVKKSYSDASASIHFMFISTPRPDIYGVRLEEHSTDIYSSFKEMAEATGGFIDSSANPSYLFQQALKASENYYLLYYSPKDYKFDKKFKTIKVRIKDKNYKIFHRSGYFAD